MEFFKYLINKMKHLCKKYALMKQRVLKKAKVPSAYFPGFD